MLKLHFNYLSLLHTFQPLQYRSKLTLHLASSGPTRFITDSGSLVQPSSERYQHSPIPYGISMGLQHARQRTAPCVALRCIAVRIRRERNLTWLMLLLLE